MAVGEQLLDDLGVAVGVLGLEDRPLVPVDPEPRERVEDLLDVLGRGALAVGVLDAQHELAARGRGRAASCRAPSARRRCAARRSATEAKRTRMAAQHAMNRPADADRRPRLPRRRPGQRRRARRRARLPARSRSSTRARAPWKPRVYTDEEVAAFHEAMDGLDVDALLIHAVYLLNCASEDTEIREKSLTSLTVALRGGRGARRRRRGAAPGLGAEGRRRRARRSSAPAKVDRARRWRSPRTARCTSRTPPARAGRSGARSRSWRALIELAGGGKRLGVCLDSCHLLASGYDVRTARGAGATCSTSSTASSGCDRLGSLHVNDSKTPLGSNRDRHANLGDGEIGARGHARRSCPSRASRACRACSRARADRQGDRAADIDVGDDAARARRWRAQRGAQALRVAAASRPTAAHRPDASRAAQARGRRRAGSGSGAGIGRARWSQLGLQRGVAPATR